MLRSATLFIVCALLLACQSTPEPSAPAAEAAASTLKAPQNSLAERRQPGAAFDYVYLFDEPMRHAYKDPTLKPQAKADGNEVRVAYPENYAITVPPTPQVRSMVEWEPMQSIVMQIPDYIASYDGVMQTIQGISVAAIDVAEVWFVVESAAMQSELKGLISAGGVSTGVVNAKTRFLTANLESLWFIDSGPLPIIDPSTDTYAFADFRYYQNRAWDDGIPTLLGRSLLQMGEPNNTETYRMPIDTEGGTFQATSDGVCFTGARQLYNMSCGDTGCNADLLYLPLSELQNHPYTQELEASWGAYAGCEDVVVTYSITDDGTGHIDMYMKVASDDLVIMGEYVAPFGNDQAAYNAGRLNANAEFLESYVKPNGGTFEVGRIVMPGHRNTNSGPVPFTYINSTLINGVNIWPATTYSDWVPSRQLAASQWQSLMPDYNHVWVDSTELSFWSGAIHCITRTIPDKSPGLWIGDGSCGGGNCEAPAGGYDHACYPTNYTSDPICWGPDWQCSCNDCDLCGPPITDGSAGPDNPCGDIGYEGCCDGNTLTYCDNGELKGGNCGGQGCGWDSANGYYDCGGSGADPSGTFPISCDPDEPCVPDCEGNACGDDGCGGSCGACAAGELCSAEGSCEPVCTPECGDALCGDDGCGGSCGICPGDTICDAGACVTAPSPCGDLTYEGCCDGLVLNWCQDGEPLTQNCEDSCGWNTEYGYLCGESGQDPSGVFPLQCPGSCVPDCSGKTCGDDGCGGSCGTCEIGSLCEAGQCVEGPCEPSCQGKDCGPDGCGGDCGACPEGQGCSVNGLCLDVCVPNCEGKVCGSDGCGGSCGSCASGEDCEAGLCVGGCGDLTFEGCCDDTVLSWCTQAGDIETLNCSTSCGWSAANDYYDCGQTGADPSGTHPLSCDELTCTPECDGKVCGDDGCGGSCGSCPSGELCDAGACQSGPCMPDCEGKVCGADGCGGSCGSCPESQFCTDAGLCEQGACTSDCEGKVCGDDGCGGSCGMCPAGESCTDQGDCKVTSCTPDCDDKVCGADGCGGSCGSCELGTICIAGTCTGGECTPDCSGKVCGSDGCGGYCGSCQPELLCTAEGICVLPECTPDCSGKVCGADGCGGTCGACPAGQGCTPGGQCVNICTPDCEDKVCGADGCGGLCGTCDDGEYCTNAGVCEEGACVPDCDAKACGDDGCGALCGTCPDDEVCSPQYECVPPACEPDCSVKDCGDDGCGGSCGVCSEGLTCSKDFRCEPAPCEPDCEGKACGSDGCGGLCGSCSAGEECTKDGACNPGACVPQCEDLECGDDGCGAPCGVCAEGTSCDDGRCLSDSEGVPSEEREDEPSGSEDSGSGTSEARAEGSSPELSGEGEGAELSAEGCQGSSTPSPLGPLMLLACCALWRRRGALHRA